jgi:hypothetical protein
MQRRFSLEDAPGKQAVSWPSPEPTDFWSQVEPVLTLIPGDILDRKGFSLTGSTNRYTVVTKRHDYKLGSGENHNYWIQVLDESVERDSMGASMGGKELFSVKKASTFEEAMILHHSVLKHLADMGY